MATVREIVMSWDERFSPSPLEIQAAEAWRRLSGGKPLADDGKLARLLQVVREDEARENEAPTPDEDEVLTPRARAVIEAARAFFTCPDWTYKPALHPDRWDDGTWELLGNLSDAVGALIAADVNKESE